MLVGPIPVSARSLAPDLARGTMLLMIALANAHFYLYGRVMSVRDYTVPESILDQAIILLQMTFIDGREYPMFTFLFGYGIVQLARRHTSKGVDEVAICKLVRRRGAWMILFGFLHALLLFSGDILGAYGLIAVLLAGPLIRASDQKLLIMAAGWAVLIVAFKVLMSLTPQGLDSFLHSSFLLSVFATDPLVAAVLRVKAWVPQTIVSSLFSLISVLLLGGWAARRRLLDEPERYRRLLICVAVLGMGLAAVGAFPLALMAAGWWPDRSAAVTTLAGLVHTVTGYAGGIGYAAIAGLLAIGIRNRNRRGSVVAALAACGQRSMTCYLLQSVVFVAVLAAYGGGLGDLFGLTAVTVLAVVTWALTVLLAEVMSRLGYRGPAEVLLRRLTYGRFTASGGNHRPA